MHGVAVCDNADFFYNHVTEELHEFGVDHIDSRQICDVIDGYKSHGYGKSTTAELGK